MHKILTIGAVCGISFAISAAAQGPQNTSGASNNPKPLIAVPEFENRTGGYAIRVVPGKYDEKNVRVGSDSTHESEVVDGKRIDKSSQRDVYQRMHDRIVQYAPGEWQLPLNASAIAADVVSEKLTAAGQFRILNRSALGQKQIDSERGVALTTGGVDALMKTCKDLKAKYLVTGAISNFRVDERSTEAYGVTRKLVSTRVSLDLRVVDVETGEVVFQSSPRKIVELQIPEGVTQITDIYDWESVLRTAIEQASGDLINGLAKGIGGNAAVAEIVTIHVESTPSGADILVDGDFVGNTPADIKIAKSKHALRIEKQSYQSWERNISAIDGMKVAPTLEKVSAPPPKS